MGMKQAYIFAAFFVGFSICNACEESLLVVGGMDESGPLSSMYLLTSNGWCQDINFPSLPEPIVNPGVYVFEESRNMKIIIIVCGFADGNCKWTNNGAVNWYGLEVPSSPYHTGTTKNFQILALDDQNLSMMSI
eukprot:TRINITY_DN17635_c0_g1_i1.p1 TRINITY_DN17635_c0_g1~~TRINITY_DN17635_c0_g1_i1.p1  ORF type:complete len:134 (+),score=10.97 TRINITY_DN17635_c0_g1_i1:103-504(+)